MSWRGNGKSGEVSSPSVARRSLVHGGVTATTVIFCFPSSENPCPSFKRMCPALFPFGAFSAGFMKRPDVCFSIPLNRPKEERKTLFCVTATPGRAERGGPTSLYGGCRRRGEVGRDERVHTYSGAAALSRKNARRPCPRPGRASQAGRAEGAADRTPAGRVVRGSRRPWGRPAWRLFLPLTPQPGPAAAADLRPDFCSGRRGRGGEAIDLNRISPQTLLVCCCYASIWRSLFINERVRSVPKTLRARICVIKLKAG